MTSETRKIYRKSRLAAALVLVLVLLAGTVAAGASPVSLVVDGRVIPCDVPPQNVGGRVLVPIRAVAEALGCQVAWDQAGRRVVVTSAQAASAPAGASSQEAAAGGSGIRAVDVSQAYAEAAPSVVAILHYALVNGEETIDSWGSGFVISSDGEVVTCAHVVAGATRLKVLFPNGRAYDVGTDILADSVSDIALIELHVSGLSPLTFADSDQVRVGEPVIAIGNPAMMQLENTVTSGIVSGAARRMEDSWYPAIQTDAAINPGNSGGPLLDAAGRVIGMTNSKLVDETLEGLGFAVPSNVVREIVAELKEHGRVIRPWLGVSVQSSPEARYGLPTDKGLTVVAVDPSGPAQAAGVRSADELIAIDGQPTHSIADLSGILLSHKVGDVVVLTLRRVGVGQLELRVTLRERPAGQ